MTANPPRMASLGAGGAAQSDSETIPPPGVGGDADDDDDDAEPLSALSALSATSATSVWCRGARTTEACIGARVAFPPPRPTGTVHASLGAAGASPGPPVRKVPAALYRVLYDQTVTHERSRA